MLHYICALKCEARPFIEHYRLKHYSPAGLFSIYSDPEHSVTLTISGTGKIAAANAVLYTHMLLEPGEPRIWLNAGIAGHAEHQIGDLYLCHRLEDAGNGQLWYPQILVDSQIPGESLKTVDAPALDYSHDHMFDMEASGIFTIACRISSLELIHSLKVISDNREHPVIRPDKNRARELLAARSEEICDFAAKLCDLLSGLPAGINIEEDFRRLSGKFHFSSYQQNRLRGLLRRWRIHFPELPASDSITVPTGNANEVLESLQQQIDQAPFVPGE